MTKIMLVEDDKSLREIYGVRLLAEGYDIVSAGDGEEALAVAIKERPVLIVTDVMMPKISGFDMLDILRSTTETRNIKVIMMTALSSDEHRQRGEQMGADRYLVKSQVGIEDVVRVVHEVLGDTPGVAPSATPAPAVQQPQTRPAAPQPVAPRPSAPAAAPQQQSRPIVSPPQQPVQSPIQPQQQQYPQQPAQHPAMPAASLTTPAAPSTRQRIIQPINDPTAQVNINDLLDKELAKESSGTEQIATTEQERNQVQSQLNSLPNLAPQPSQEQQPSAVPGITIDAQGHVINPQQPASQQPQAPQPPRGPLQTPPRQ